MYTSTISPSAKSFSSWKYFAASLLVSSFNLPLFLPDYAIGNRFSILLDKYPVTPYLDTRDSFLRWVVFIHNKVNASIHKDELTMTEALNAYYLHYVPKKIAIMDELKYKEKLIYFSFLIAGIYGAYVLYNK